MATSTLVSSFRLSAKLAGEGVRRLGELADGQGSRVNRDVFFSLNRTTKVNASSVLCFANIACDEVDDLL
jgi:hypothetical protein